MQIFEGRCKPALCKTTSCSNNMVSSNQSDDSWPLELYPALDPRCYQTPKSFQTLRKSREELLQLIGGGSDIYVHWRTVSVRDGTSLDVLCYEPNNVSTSGGLLVAIHGGGRYCPEACVVHVFLQKAASLVISDTNKGVKAG